MGSRIRADAARYSIEYRSVSVDGSWTSEAARADRDRVVLVFATDVVSGSVRVRPERWGQDYAWSVDSVTPVVLRYADVGPLVQERWLAWQEFGSGALGVIEVRQVRD